MCMGRKTCAIPSQILVSFSYSSSRSLSRIPAFQCEMDQQSLQGGHKLDSYSGYLGHLEVLEVIKLLSILGGVRVLLRVEEP